MSTELSLYGILIMVCEIQLVILLIFNLIMLNLFVSELEIDEWSYLFRHKLYH